MDPGTPNRPWIADLRPDWLFPYWIVAGSAGGVIGAGQPPLDLPASYYVAVAGVIPIIFVALVAVIPERRAEWRLPAPEIPEKLRSDPRVLEFEMQRREQEAWRYKLELLRFRLAASVLICAGIGEVAALAALAVGSSFFLFAVATICLWLSGYVLLDQHLERLSPEPPDGKHQSRADPPMNEPSG
jgi:hypothetical protein